MATDKDTKEDSANAEEEKLEINPTTVDADENVKEEKSESKDIQSVCDISINQIFTQLHVKATEQANSVNADIKVQNSAIEGEKESDAKFFGAGQHIIAAIAAKVGEDDEAKITKKQALPSLQAYVQWFAGPDIQITEDSLIELPAGSTTASTSKDDKKKDNDKKPDANSSNESIYVPSFLQYLVLEDSEDSEEGNESSENSEDAAAGKDEKAAKAGDDEPKAIGWYITFNLDIKGQQSKPLSDALKSFGKKILEGFGVQTFDWRTGATGEVKTIGDMLDSLDAVFGKLDPDELQASYSKNLKQKFPQGNAQAQIWDTKTINQYLKNQLDSKGKSKLKTAELALCTRIDKKDKSYKLYNAQAIADLVTASIKGVFKKFKNKISKDDVIMVNNYDDDKNKDKEAGEVTDSMMPIGKMLVEDTQQKVMPGEVRKELDALVKADLKDYKPSASVGSTDKIIEILKKRGIDEQKWFTELQNAKSKYCFMIKTVEPIEDEKEAKPKEDKKDVSASLKTCKSLLSLLFEKSLPKDTDIGDKVKNIFRKLIDKFKDSANQKELKFDSIDILVGHTADKEMKESIAVKKSLQYMRALYEDIDDTFDLLFETHSQKKLDQKKYDKFKDTISGHLEDIRKNKDAIVKQSYTNKETGKPYSWADIKEKPKDAKNSGYEDFAKTLFDGNASEEDTIKKLDSITHNSNFRNDIVYRFKYEPPKEEEKEDIEITFIDRDPNEQKEDKEIAKVKKEEGKELELPEPPKYAGWEFKGWKPDPEEMEKSGETFSEYEEQQNDEEDDVEVTYMDIDDPSKQDDEKQYKEMKKIVKNPDGSVESPTPKEKKGYKFDKWEPDPDEMSKSGQTFAKYKKDESDEDKDENDKKTQVVYYVIPDENGILDGEQYTVSFYTTDLKNPEDKSKWKPFGDPQTIASPKDLKFPTDVPEEIDGRKFTSWMPSEKDFKSNAIDKYYADEKHTVDGEDGKKTIAILAQYGDAEKADNNLKTKHTDLDFYIVPMKNLTYNTRKARKDK